MLRKSSIKSLPREVQLKILGNLKIDDFINFSMVSPDWELITRDFVMCRRFFQEELLNWNWLDENLIRDIMTMKRACHEYNVGLLFTTIRSAFNYRQEQMNLYNQKSQINKQKNCILIGPGIDMSLGVDSFFIEKTNIPASKSLKLGRLNKSFRRLFRDQGIVVDIANSNKCSSKTPEPDFVGERMSTFPININILKARRAADRKGVLFGGDRCLNSLLVTNVFKRDNGTFSCNLNYNVKEMIYEMDILVYFVCNGRRDEFEMTRCNSEEWTSLWEGIRVELDAFIRNMPQQSVLLICGVSDRAEKLEDYSKLLTANDIVELLGGTVKKSFDDQNPRPLCDCPNKWRVYSLLSDGENFVDIEKAILWAAKETDQ